ncbi:MAG: ABC transporter permease, partial [Gemmatimonadota bacterium]
MSGHTSFRGTALRLLLRLYPRDFRDDVGGEWLASYERRAAAAAAAGVLPYAAFWARAVSDSVRNGPGERMNPGVWWRRRGGWGLDMHRATRRLLRAPGFTLATVGTLAVGLGSFAVVWSAVDNVLLEPPAYKTPGDLYFVWRDYRAIFDLDRGWLSGPDVLAFDTAGGVLAGAAAVRRDLPPVILNPGTPPRELAVMSASGGLFGLLGVEAALGRTFTPADDEPGSPRVAVLGHELWVNEFGASRDVLGRTIRVDDEQFGIVGVMPRPFRFARHGSGVPPATAELYVTFSVDLAAENPGSGSYAGLVRARPGTPPDAVHAAVERLGRQLDEHYFQGRGVRYFPVPLMADLVAPIRPALTVLGAAAAFLVLVLTVNLATLLLGRAAQREREFAVSRALGADGWTLGRAALMEGALLGLLGAGAALLLALWGTSLLVEMAPADLPRRGEIAVDGSVAATVLILGVALGIVGGIVPALWASRTHLSHALRQAAVRGGGGHTRMRRGMVVMQVALSLVLLAAGGVLVRSFEALLRSDPGFRTEGAVTFRIPVSGPAYDSVSAVNALHDRILTAVGALPGVQQVGGISGLPLSGDVSQLTVSFPGAPGNTGQAEHDVPLVDVVSVTEGALGALSIRLLDGEG